MDIVRMNNNINKNAILTCLGVAMIVGTASTVVILASRRKTEKLHSNKNNKKNESSNNSKHTILESESNNNKMNPEPKKLIRLSDAEHNLLCMKAFPPINTITWFEASPPLTGAKDNASKIDDINMDEISDWICNQIKRILCKNPWLHGKFVLVNGHYHIAYSESDGAEVGSVDLEKEGIFQRISPNNSKIFYGMPCTDITKIGMECSYLLRHKNDLNQPLWKICIVPCFKSPNRRFAIFTSMSHYVGDGRSYYAVQNMLLENNNDNSNSHDHPNSTHDTDNRNTKAFASSNNNGTPVNAIRALQPERVEGTEKLRAEAKGEKNDINKTSVKLCFVRGLLNNILLGRGEMSTRIFMVDQAKIDKIKQAEMARPEQQHPFVSTNDVITSWIFCNSQLPHGMMVVDFRGRVKGHENPDLIGNYSDPLLYKCPSETKTPGDIRTSVQTFLRRAVLQPNGENVDDDCSSSSSSFGFWDMVWQDKANVTNWSNASAQKNVTGYFVPGCQELCHFPGMVATSEPTSFVSYVIFRAKPGKLGIMIIGKSDVVNIRAPFESEEKIYD